MSQLTEKIARGERTSEQDWTEHLIEAHRLAPSMTPQAFASYATNEGLNSYQFLARSLDTWQGKDITVLDLACGDGHLTPALLAKLGRRAQVIGADMSDAELAVAKRNHSDSRLSFHCARAHALPIDSASVDAALSHMAFMLMVPAEPVIAELRRVLKPGAPFAAVIGNSSPHADLWPEIRKRMGQFLTSRYPMIQEAKSSDPRVNSRQGLEDLFSVTAGFQGEVQIEDFELNVKTSPEGVWDFVRDMYFINVLSKTEKQELAQEIKKLGAANLNSAGHVAFKYPLRKFTVFRAG